MFSEFDWKVDVAPSDKDVQALRNNLRAYNLRQVSFEDGQELAIFLRKQLSATPPTIAAHHSKEKSK